MSNCKHETAIVSHSIEKLGLTQMICTWQCQKLFWMLQTGLTTKEVPDEEAAKMITVISSNTNESAGRIRIEPQPEALPEGGTWLYPDGEWLYDGKVFKNKNAMSDYLFDAVYSEGLGNSTDFDECEPILIDGVWYWEAW